MNKNNTKPENNHQSTFGGKYSKSKISGASFVGGKEDFWRYAFIWFVMLMAMFGLMAQAYHLQVSHHKIYQDKANEFITAKRKTPVVRGMITDTFGVPLAASAPIVTVVFSPYDYAQQYYQTKKNYLRAKSDEGRKNVEQKINNMSLERLASVSKFSLEELQAMVKIDESVDVYKSEAVKNALPSGAGSKRVVLLDGATPEEAEVITDLKFWGVFEEKSMRRFYLQAEPMAQILGYVARSDKDDLYKGRSGIEAQYQDRLSGQPGENLILKDASQQALRQLKEITPQVPAQDIQLTIDSRLQYVLYKELEQVGMAQSARWASGIVVDITTGDVLAMGSWPSFNANNLSTIKANEANRVLLDAFEPGSVMKPFTVAAALESGKYTTNSVIDTSPGRLFIQGHSIRDGANYGQITLAQLIQKSSNVASATIALNLPTDAIVKMQYRFGFNKKTAINFNEEKAGDVQIPNPKAKSLIATLSYGYGQTVTLGQLAQAYTVFGSDGQLRPLRLIKSEPHAIPEQVISKEHAHDILAMMELVTQQGGTARQAAINGYRVAGKTGTARRISPYGGYAEGEYRTIFVGIAPVSNPRFVAAILVEDPRERTSGGVVSGPVFSKVMQEALRLYNIPEDKPRVDR